jgi:hypothetical protein
MIISLPNNESATLRSYKELSERQARRIRAALRSALEEAGNLAAHGFDENDPSTWGVLKDFQGEEGTAIEHYQDRCIVEMVKSWTLGELPTIETAGDLPSETYALLAEAAVAQTRDDTDWSADGAADPKVAIEESNDSEPISLIEDSNRLTPRP